MLRLPYGPSGFVFTPVEIKVGMEKAYAVSLAGTALGFVWKTRVLSYRGTEGWNRGLRIRDYNPVEWRAASVLGGHPATASRSRKGAAQALNYVKAGA